MFKPHDMIQLSRRSVLTAVALSLSYGQVRGAVPAKLTSREIVRLLFEARREQRIDLSYGDLSGLDLSDINFKGAVLHHCNLFGVDFTDANLTGSDLSDTILDRAVLLRTNLSNASLRSASIRRPAVFTDMRFYAGDLPLFRGSDLRSTQITARLDGADFSRSDLSGAVFSLSSERDLGGTPTGGLANCDFTGAKLVNTNLSGMSLAFSIFRSADLSGANLEDADLTRADLTGATLTNVKLTRAKLDGVLGLATAP